MPVQQILDKRVLQGTVANEPCRWDVYGASDNYVLPKFIASKSGTFTGLVIIMRSRIISTARNLHVNR